LDNAIEELSSVAAKIPQEWDPFEVKVLLGETSVQNPRIAFRPPRGAELKGEWSSYSRLHDDFYVAYYIYRTGILIGALEGLQRDQQLERQQRSRADQDIIALRDRMGVIIREHFLLHRPGELK